MSLSEDVRKKVEDLRARANRLRTQAKERIPEAYHAFILDLEQSTQIARGLKERPGDLDGIPGVWMKQGDDGKWAVYATVELPYVQVDGRAAMARDEHTKAGKRLRIEFIPESVRLAASLLHAAGLGVGVDEAAIIEALKTIPDETKSILTCMVDSEIYGQYHGSARIGWGGTGVDRTNPYENAQTSAAGRALGFMGYGLIGGGIASYEEVVEAKRIEKSLRGTSQQSDSGGRTATDAPPAEQPPEQLRSESDTTGDRPVSDAEKPIVAQPTARTSNLPQSRKKFPDNVICIVCKKQITEGHHLLWISQMGIAADKAIAAGKSPVKDPRTNQPVSFIHPVHPRGHCQEA